MSENYKNLISKLKEALEASWVVKEECVEAQQWEKAAMIRDFGDSIKRIITKLETKDTDDNTK